MLPSFLTPYRTVLLALTITILGISGIAPPWPKELLLQHIPTLAGICLLLWGAHKYGLSNAGYTCVILFLLLHIIGARWIYSYVPYDDWFARLTGRTISELFGFRRNHYDRLVHFAYGALLVGPAREIIARTAKIRPTLAWWFALEFILATSMLYEIAEWLIAILLSPEAAEAYNGQQGDMWDAQKDMALAATGALLATGWWAITRRTQRKKSDKNTFSPAKAIESEG